MVIEFEQLDKKQKQAISYYSKGAFIYINKNLRENRFPPSLDLLSTESTTRIIDDIFFSVPAKKSNPPIIYRGTCNDIIYNNPKFKVAQFMSTSLKENIAQKFLPPANGVLLKIHLKNSNINILEIESQFKEHEYLMPQNIGFRVLYREISAINNQQVPCIGICPF